MVALSAGILTKVNWQETLVKQINIYLPFSVIQK